MENIFTEPISILMTGNGHLTNPIDLKSLCTVISIPACKKAEIVKFIGFNKIYFFDPSYTYHSDENKYFFNQCTFEFKSKVTIKLFSNGTYIVTGCILEEVAKRHLSLLMTVLSGKKYAYLPNKLCTNGERRLQLIYDVEACTWKSFNVALANYSISLLKYEFNKYKVINISKYMNEDEWKQIESITDIFKYSSVSIKLRNVNGNIDIYKNKVIISVQNTSHYQKLLDFFNKYKYKLISIPVHTTVSKLIYLNTVFKYKQQKYNQPNSSTNINATKKIELHTQLLLDKINN